MQAVQTSMATPSSTVRRTRSVSTPIGNEPTTPISAIAKGSRLTSKSLM
jgi:hypothetical protein